MLALTFSIEIPVRKAVGTKIQKYSGKAPFRGWGVILSTPLHHPGSGW
jgi:hypothetical protein